MKRFVRSIVPMPVLEAYWAPYATERGARRLSAAELELVAGHCAPDALALDVGANLGSYTWHLARLARVVHAFEPIPSVAFNLRSAFAFGRAGRVSVKVHRVALSDCSGSTMLRIPLHRDEMVTGLATIENTGLLSDLPTRAIRVRVARLDDFAFDGRIGFIKIDVEGHEEAVLFGASETLRKHRPAIYIESNGGAVRRVTKFLCQFGYKGWFRYGKASVPVEQFDPQQHQPNDALNELRQPTGRGQYVSNFLFSTSDY